MSSKDNIQLLDNSVIQKLRSSVVISSLTQCIKELIHNAIDARATAIEIIVDAEKFSLQVNDNGYGIQNLHKIGQRHVTSKCHTLSDINHIQSFGFRGEALSAIVNESTTQIISRYYLSGETYEGIWRDGKLIGKIDQSKYTQKSRSGTSIIVKDLFYKYPVRRRKAATEYQHIVALEPIKRLVTTFALCFHYINFTLIDKSRNNKILIVKKSNNSFEAFKQLFGIDVAKQLQMLAIQEGNVTVEGFISTQSYPNKSRQFIYLNNYIVPGDNELYKIISDIFNASNLLNIKGEKKAREDRFIKKYPIYLIKLSCKEWSSYELYMYLELLSQFSSYEVVVSLLKKYVQKLLKIAGFTLTEQHKGEKRVQPETSILSHQNDPYLRHSPAIPASVISHKTTSTTSGYASKYLSWWNADTETMLYIDPKTGNSFSSDQLPNTPAANKIDRTHLKRAKLHHLPDTPKQNLNNSNLFKTLLPTLKKPIKLSKSDLLHIKVLGQADKKFIILKLLDTQKMILIDQHAADERVKLEEMLRNMKSVFTLEPTIPIQVNAKEFQLLTSKDIIENFRNWGIHFVPKTSVLPSQQSRFFSTEDTSPHFSEQKSVLYVTQLPKHVVDRSVTHPSILKSIICDHLYWLLDQSDELMKSKTCPRGLIEILKSRACRSAIMFNDELSLTQCEQLIQKLATCNFPFQCAHGRPSAVPIHVEENILSKKEIRRINWDKFK